MGGFVLFLAANGNTTGAPGFQLAIGRWLMSVSQDVLRWLDPVPQPILGLGLLALAALFFVAAVRGRKNPPSLDDPLEDRHEHEDGEEASSLAVEREPAGTTPSCH
jgi:hypothetical protein